MRIAVVSNTSWSIYNFRRSLIAALAGQGHAVLAIGSCDEYLQCLQAQGLVACGVPFSRSGINPWHEFRTILSIRRALRSHGADLVLSFTPKGNIYSALALPGLRGRLVANVSGLGQAFSKTGLLVWFMGALYAWTFRRAYRVFFQNEEDRRHLLARIPLSPERVGRLPGSGIDLDRFTPQPLVPRSVDAPVFLMHGRLLWDKGVGAFVEAARRLRAEYPDARYHLLGMPQSSQNDGPTRAQLDEWSRDGRVDYLGWTDDVRPFIADADCVVLPSAYGEGVPRALLEAGAMGRPAIASDIAGCRAVVDDDVNGLLCRPDDADSLVAAMRRFIRLGRETRERIGRQARAKVERDFDERAVIAAYLAVVEEVDAKTHGIA